MKDLSQIQYFVIINLPVSILNAVTGFRFLTTEGKGYANGYIPEINFFSDSH